MTATAAELQKDSKSAMQHTHCVVETLKIWYTKCKLIVITGEMLSFDRVVHIYSACVAVILIAAAIILGLSAAAEGV